MRIISYLISNILYLYFPYGSVMFIDDALLELAGGNHTIM